ncbi:hypothetical protein FEI17_26950 (plasmid) [Kosakonia radicincitans]|uniref:hypothetical protein n=1 Tax=Kosakonia radicincitans TaxID=283686 RepID=UPI0011EE4193|nr:hypothetical protein [Kosakonia radicincitans]QEM94277.1 hypothetical protein FEI17_26950 [Kosakonia radicincitans]
MKPSLAATKNAVGQSADMLPLLRIRLPDNWTAEFDRVDTRFNDCCNWQVMNGSDRVLFSTRMYQRFSDMKSGVIATVDVCEGRSSESDKRQAEAGKMLLAVLDKYPSFAALAKHPDCLN